MRDDVTRKTLITEREARARKFTSPRNSITSDLESTPKIHISQKKTQFETGRPRLVTNTNRYAVSDARPRDGVKHQVTRTVENKEDKDSKPFVKDRR